MKRTLAVAFAVLAVTTPHLVSAARLNDDEVKRLFEQIDQQRDRFEDQLDGI
jgi:hypothetical protein